MNPSYFTSRRAVLTGAGAVVGVAFTAGCSSSTDNPTPLTEIAGQELTATEPDIIAEQQAEAESAPAAEPIAKLADIPVGSSIAATSADGKKIILSQPEEGTVVGFSAICTHQGCEVTPSDSRLNCPCHGAVFDGATGEALEGPTRQALPAFAVRVDGDDVFPGSA